MQHSIKKTILAALAFTTALAAASANAGCGPSRSGSDDAGNGSYDVGLPAREDGGLAPRRTGAGISPQGGTLTGATTGGGLVVTSGKIGLVTSCSNGQVEVWNGSAWVCGVGGITMSAGANVIPKSDGTNLVSSTITDTFASGGQVAIAGGAQSTVFNYIPGGQSTFIRGGLSSSNVYIGDVNTTGAIIIGNTTATTSILGDLHPSSVGPFTLVASQANYGPAGFNHAMEVLVVPTTNIDIHGFVAQADGFEFYLVNADTAGFVVTLRHESASATITNRMTLPDQQDKWSLYAGCSAKLRYNAAVGAGTPGRWQVITWGCDNAPRLVASNSALTSIFTGPVTVSGVLTAQGNFVSNAGSINTIGHLRVGTISPTLTGGATVHDWTPTGLVDAQVIWANCPSGICTIDGITGVAEGRKLTIYNTGAGEIDFPNNTGSTVGNRMNVSAGVGILTLAGNQGCSADFVYNSTTLFWEQTGFSCESMILGNLTTNGNVTINSGNVVTIGSATTFNGQVTIGALADTVAVDTTIAGLTNNYALGASTQTLVLRPSASGVQLTGIAAPTFSWRRIHVLNDSANCISVFDDNTNSTITNRIKLEVGATSSGFVCPQGTMDCIYDPNLGAVTPGRWACTITWAQDSPNSVTIDGNLSGSGALIFQSGQARLGNLNLQTVSPSAITGTVADWNPGSSWTNGLASRLDVALSGNATLQGLLFVTNDTEVELCNVSASFDLTIANNVGGTATNRFQLGNDTTSIQLIHHAAPNFECATFHYDTGQTRWALRATTASIHSDGITYANGNFIVAASGFTSISNSLTVSNNLTVTGTIQGSKILSETQLNDFTRGTEYFEDFLDWSVSTTAGADTHWLYGTNTIQDVTHAASNLPGLVGLVTLPNGTGLGNAVSFIVKGGTTAGSGFFAGGGQIDAAESVLVNTVPNGTNAEFIVGAFDTTGTVAPTNGIYCKASNASANWQVCTTKASTSTCVATSATVAITAAHWYRCQFQVNAAGTSVLFTITDVTGATSGTATNSTNIPNTSSNVIGMGASIDRIGTTGSGNISIDYVWFKQTFTTAR